MVRQHRSVRGTLGAVVAAAVVVLAACGTDLPDMAGELTGQDDGGIQDDGAVDDGRQGDDGDAPADDAPTDDGDAPDMEAPADEDSARGPGIDEVDRWMSAVAVYPDGTRIELGVEVGQPVAASELGNDRPAACDLDDERDVVIPARVLATPRTAGFTYVIQAGVQARLAPGVDAEVRGELHSGRADAECNGADDRRVLVGANWGETRPDDQEQRERSGRFSIIVRGYFSPAHPDGDDELLGGIALELNTWNRGFNAEAEALESPRGSGMVLWDGTPVLTLTDPHGFSR